MAGFLGGNFGEVSRLIASLELKDQFTGPLSKADRALGSTERRFSTLEQVGYTTGRGLRNAADNLGRLAVGGAALIGSQVALGVRSLTQLAEVTNQTAAVIKSTGGAAGVTADQIRDQAEALESLTTIDDKAIQAGQNMLLTFRNIRNEAGAGNDIFNQATKAVLDLSVAMGTEPKNAALQLGKALNDPIRGLGTLRRVGIQFTEEQEDQIKALVEAGDVMSAQKVILRELNTEFAHSAEQFGKGPGATMRRFGDAVEGAQQALATGFLPLMEKVSERVQEALGNKQVLANIKAFGESAAAGIDQLISIGTKLPWDAIGASAKLMGEGAKALLDAFTAMPDWVQTAVLTGWGLNKLTGGAIGSIASTLTKSLFGAIRGSTPFTPVFTKEVGIPGVGGGPEAGAEGLLSRLGGLIFGAGAGALPVVLTAGTLAALGAAFVASQNVRRDPFAHPGDVISPGRGFGRIDEHGPPGVRVTNPLDIATPIGQFVAQNRGGTPRSTTTSRGTAADTAAVIGIRAMHKGIVAALERGDVHEALRLKALSDGLRGVRGAIEQRVNALIPHLGRTNQALSVANRKLDEGNRRQRELAAGIRSARDRIGTGFSSMGRKQDAANSRLATIAAKDFSPNVNVTVPVSTYVSISDIVRQASTYNVATSLASQTRAGLLRNP